MAPHNELGTKGEEIAANYLTHNGYKIFHKNWYYRNQEIDIIAEYKNYLVIVEVKTRTFFSAEVASPLFAVNRKKQKLIVDAADAYVRKFNIDKDVRFDIISIIFKKDIYDIEHIEDAFYPLAK